MKRAALVLFPLLFACQRSAPVRVVAPPPPPPLAAPHVVPGELDARVLLGDLPARAQRLGAGPLAVAASADATDGERVGAFVDLPRDLCLLAYARASRTVEDVDLAAFSEEGTPLVVDDGPDAHPTVMLCPPHPDRVYLAAHVASGEGLVAVAAHLLPRGRSGDVGRAFGARGGSDEAPRPLEGWQGIADLVAAHRATRGGHWDELRRVAINVDPRGPTLLSVSFEPEQCIDALAVPDDEVGMIDLELLEPSGASLARAHGVGRSQSLLACSNRKMTATLTVRPHAGRGPVALVLAAARGDSIRDLAIRPEVFGTAALLPVDRAQNALDAELGRAGYGAPSAWKLAELRAGQRVSVSLEIPRSFASCARVDVVGGRPLAGLFAALVDDKGALLAEGEGATGTTLFSCGLGKLRLDAEGRTRPGPVAFAVRREPWTDPAFGAEPLAASRMLGRMALGPRSVLPGKAGPVRVLAVDADHIATGEHSIAARACVRVAAGGAGAGVGLSLRLFDTETGDELDRSEAAHGAAVSACAGESTRRIRSELHVAAGKLAVVAGERVLEVSALPR